jgi:glycosyltransferase involved in cell wall biosynthesis
MKISIVIPCFNAEKYLRECLDTCLQAPHDLIEVICVDDSSTDSTLSVIESYERKFSCIRSVKHAENLGTLEARRSGSIAATGDYILYLDPDDLLLPDIIGTLSERLNKQQSDALFFRFEVFGECQGHRRKEWEKWQNGHPSLENCFSAKPSAAPIIWSCAWNRQLILNAFESLPSGYCIFSEDCIMLLILFTLVKKSNHIDDIGYRYRLDSGITANATHVTKGFILKKIRSYSYIMQFGRLFKERHKEFFRYYDIFDADFKNVLRSDIEAVCAREQTAGGFAASCHDAPLLGVGMQILHDYLQLFNELKALPLLRFFLKMKYNLLGILMKIRCGKVNRIASQRANLKRLCRLLAKR